MVQKFEGVNTFSAPRESRSQVHPKPGLLLPPVTPRPASPWADRPLSEEENKLRSTLQTARRETTRPQTQTQRRTRRRQHQAPEDDQAAPRARNDRSTAHEKTPSLHSTEPNGDLGEGDANGSYGDGSRHEKRGGGSEEGVLRQTAVGRAPPARRDRRRTDSYGDVGEGDGTDSFGGDDSCIARGQAEERGGGSVDGVLLDLAQSRSGVVDTFSMGVTGGHEAAAEFEFGMRPGRRVSQQA